MSEAGTPQQLDAAGIAARIPHAGRMCLLQHLLAWDAQQLHARANDHDAPDHPLRGPQGLGMETAIEMAAQAMALHGGLLAPPGSTPSAGYIASVRGVQLHRRWLHDAAGPLDVRAQRLAGDERQVMYAFSVHDARGAALAEGRATVVLNTPLPGAAAP